MTAQFKTDVIDLTSNDDGIRPNAPRILAVHTFEGQDLDVHRMMDYQSGRLEHQRTGSYHVVFDATGTSGRENDNEYVPWAAGWTGNRIALHACLAGKAAFTRAQWLQRGSQLDALARWLAFESKANAIPLERASITSIRTNGRGLAGHGDFSIAFPGETDHTDPGPAFPWDHVIREAIRHRDGTGPTPNPPTSPRPTGESPMTPEQARLLADNHGQLAGSTEPGKFPGWSQLGNRTIVDALAVIGTHLELDGFHDPAAK